MKSSCYFILICLLVVFTSIESFASRSQQSKVKVSSPITIRNNIILYDGVCKFCNKWVDLLLQIDNKKVMRFAALQSSYGKEALSEMGKETDDISTVIYIRSNSQFYIKSNAVLEVMKETNSGLYAIAVILGIIPLPIRDRFYDLVAKNRYNFLGKRDTCRCSDKEYSDRFLS